MLKCSVVLDIAPRLNLPLSSTKSLVMCYVCSWQARAQRFYRYIAPRPRALPSQYAEPCDVLRLLLAGSCSEVLSLHRSPPVSPFIQYEEPCDVLHLPLASSCSRVLSYWAPSVCESFVSSFSVRNTKVLVSGKDSQILITPI